MNTTAENSENNKPEPPAAQIPSFRRILVIGWLSVIAVATCSCILVMMGIGSIKFVDPNYTTIFGFSLGIVPWVSVTCALLLFWRKQFLQSFLLLLAGLAAFLLPFFLLPLMK